MGKPRKMNINSLRNLKNFRAMINAEEISETIIDALARKGEEFVRTAIESVTYNHRTWNLYDSYAWGVYDHGQLVRHGTLNTDSGISHMAKDPNHGLWGYQEAQKFLDEMEDEVNQDGISLVIGAAMFYSGILESRGYVVLANIQSDMEDLINDGIDGGAYVTDIPEGTIDGIVRRISGTPF